MMKLLSPLAERLRAADQPDAAPLRHPASPAGPDRGGAQERLQPRGRRGRHPPRGSASCSTRSSSSATRPCATSWSRARRSWPCPRRRRFAGRAASCCASTSSRACRSTAAPSTTSSASSTPRTSSTCPTPRRRASSSPKYLRSALPRPRVQARRGPLPRDAPPPHPHGHRRRRARRHGRPRDDRGRHRGAARARSRTSTTRSSPGFVAAGDRTYLLDGSLRLDDLEEQFGIAPARATRPRRSPAT